MNHFNIRTVVVAPVEGEKPKWYDPFGCPDRAIVNLPDGKQLVMATRQLASLRAAYPDTNELLAVLSNPGDGVGLMSAKQAARNSGFGRTPVPIPNTASFPQQYDGRFPASNQVQHAPPSPAPSVQVDIFIPSSNFSFSTYFHDVLEAPPYIILVFNASALGYPKMFPQPGSSFIMNCPGMELQAVPVTAIGLSFTHGGYEYCVLVDNSSVASTEEPEVSSEQSAELPED